MFTHSEGYEVLSSSSQDLFHNDRPSLKLGHFLDLEKNDHSNVIIASEDFRRVIKQGIRDVRYS